MVYLTGWLNDNACISLNTLSTYLKNKDTILNKLVTFSNKGRKRVREPENPDIFYCITLFIINTEE